MSDTSNRRERGTAEVVARVCTRRSQIVEAIYARIEEAVPTPVRDDPDYEDGVLDAIAAAVDYSLSRLGCGQETTIEIPTAALEQARRAARAGVSFGEVVRRYMAGHPVLGESVMREAERCGLFNNRQAMYDLRRIQEASLEDLTAALERAYTEAAASLEDRAGLVERVRTRQPELEPAALALVEHLLASIADADERQLEEARRSPERRRAERVQRLLDGVPVDIGEFGYELDAWHVCVIATGANAEKAVRGLAAALGRELLVVVHDGEVWAWLGGQRKPRMSDVERVLSVPGFTGVSLAIGEAARGVKGWRLTHREAQAALLVAQHSPQRLTRYLDVALEATALQDEALADSLIERYLLPLDDMRIGGQAARMTLRALFDTEYNVSSAAHPLKVHRSSVHRWREAIERRLGYRLHEHQAEIEIALRIEDLRPSNSAERSPCRRPD